MFARVDESTEAGGSGEKCINPEKHQPRKASTRNVASLEHPLRCSSTWKSINPRSASTRKSTKDSPSNIKLRTIIENESTLVKKELELNVADPLLILGLRDENLQYLQTSAPAVRINVRGHRVKLYGPADDVEAVARIFEEMITVGNKTGRVTQQDMRTLLALYLPSYSAGIRRREGTGGGRGAGHGGSEGAWERAQEGSDGDEGMGSEGGKSGRYSRGVNTTTGNTEIGRALDTRSYAERTYAEEFGDIILHTHSGESVRAKTPGQQAIVEASAGNDILFAIGPAGTGKTYTSVALAVKALKERRVKKIILARPAVEAGENLGFLPGDLKEKIDPYLRPLYDALEEMIEHEKLEFLLSKNTIEIAPLAYMRGRTLNNAFVILDEAQNATNTQMKMFLTRIGFNSRAIITGDITQTDLPKKQESGLISIQDILQRIDGITFVYLDQADVVRHKLVRDIIDAYEKFESREEEKEETTTKRGKSRRA